MVMDAEQAAELEIARENRAALHRIETKVDAFAALLEQYRPLLDAAQARLERPRFFGGARYGNGT